MFLRRFIQQTGTRLMKGLLGRQERNIVAQKIEPPEIAVWGVSEIKEREANCLKYWNRLVYSIINVVQDTDVTMTIRRLSSVFLVQCMMTGKVVLVV